MEYPPTEKASHSPKTIVPPIPIPTATFPTSAMGCMRSVASAVSVLRTAAIRTQKTTMPATHENALSTWGPSHRRSPDHANDRRIGAREEAASRRPEDMHGYGPAITASRGRVALVDERSSQGRRRRRRPARRRRHMALAPVGSLLALAASVAGLAYLAF
jgi:hypothetical protein